jgi:hypothetical protein
MHCYHGSNPHCGSIHGNVKNIWIIDWLFLFHLNVQYCVLPAGVFLIGNAGDVNLSLGSSIKVAKTSRRSRPCKHREPFQEIALPLC